MIRSTLILSAGVLAVVCFACVPPPPAAPPPPPPLATASAMVGRPISAALDCVGKKFADNVLLLDQSFPGPDAILPSYLEPTGAPLPDNVIKSDLQKAYDSAPAFFKAQLCQLDGIFVDPSRSYSWGYRENTTNQSLRRRKYVGLSMVLWQGGNHASNFTTYETGVLTALLGVLGPQYTLAHQNGPEVTVLGLLAHEMGHILWWDKIISADKTRILSCANPPPGGKKIFHKHSWFSSTINMRYPQFHYFGLDIQGNVAYNHPVRNDVQQDILSNQSQVPSDIVDIYSDEWASVFATVSPDEDFVETYELVVLTSGSPPLLDTLQVTPATGTVPIDFVPGVTSNPDSAIYQKMQWIQSCGILGPLSPPLGVR
jgi:hypothetical protein